MELTSMTICPPWFVSWSMLAMFVYPLFATGALRHVRIWRTSAPLLLILTPLFHGILLAYLTLYSIFQGMSLMGRDAPAAFAAGLAESHTMLSYGALCSAVVLLIASVIAARRRRTLTGISRGRALAVAAMTAALVLSAGVFVLTAIVHGGAAATRFDAALWIEPLAIAAGVLVLFALGAAIWLFARSGTAEAVPSASHWFALCAGLAIIIAIGSAAWLAGEWFVRIARGG